MAIIYFRMSDVTLRTFKLKSDMSTQKQLERQSLMQQIAVIKAMTESWSDMFL